MRIPHTIPDHAFEAFRCSEETKLLPNELNRTLRSEDEEWDTQGRPDSLKTLALKVLARNWLARPVLNELVSSADRDHLLELLPLGIPFKMAIKMIDYEIFWQRASEARWKFNDPGVHGNSWRQLYCERHLAGYLERLEPAYFEAELSEIEAQLELYAPYVKELKLRQLLGARMKLPEVPDAEDTEEARQLKLPQIREPETYHIPMNLVLAKLPHLTSLLINVGVIYLDNLIDWKDFQFSIEDSLKLGKGAKNLPCLKKFSITRSNLDRPRVAAILQGLAVSVSISEIDFSHCRMGDEGAQAIGGFFTSRPRICHLKTLKLVDNNIGPEGIAGIVRGMLLVNEKKRGPAVRKLDLRLNPIGPEGAHHLASLLLRIPDLENLNLSGCELGGGGGMSMAEVLTSGQTKLVDIELDISNNYMGEIVGEAFEIVAKSCSAITALDVRMCGFRKESEFVISDNVARNRARSKVDYLRRRRSSDKKQVTRRRFPSLKPPKEYVIYQKPQSYDNITIENEAAEDGAEDLDDATTVVGEALSTAPPIQDETTRSKQQLD